MTIPVLFALLAAQAPAQAPPPLPAVTENTGPTWTPQRAYDAKHKRFSDFETLAAEAAKSDVVFFGEQHNDPGTHRMELALLEAVARRRTDVVLAMEMFERDVQPLVDDYVAGRIDEMTFLHAARPWPNYMTDYRPLVEFAKAHHWRLVAGNVPRTMANAVASKGIDAVAGRTDSTRGWAAAEFNCPHDDYFDRFAETMKQHPMGSGPPPTAEEMAALTERFYQAQCVKDETMAESIARIRESSGGTPLVIHVNGAFHSDYGDGTAKRTRRRLPKAKVLVISGVPVPSLDAIEPKPFRKVADWVVFTLEPADTN
jgi:uncharacterized iron-regulated protein